MFEAQRTEHYDEIDHTKSIRFAKFTLDENINLQ